jgi:hypothetical protein
MTGAPPCTGADAQRDTMPASDVDVSCAAAVPATSDRHPHMAHKPATTSPVRRPHQETSRNAAATRGMTLINGLEQKFLVYVHSCGLAT